MDVFLSSEAVRVKLGRACHPDGCFVNTIFKTNNEPVGGNSRVVVAIAVCIVKEEDPIVTFQHVGFHCFQ